MKLIVNKYKRFNERTFLFLRINTINENYDVRGEQHVMHKANESGIWTLFIPDLGDEIRLKSDPYAIAYLTFR